ncbi:MAG: protein arginine kinase [Eubacteriales bacterium]|nr:protein arginine kinase [Bacillota bacterium]MBV1726407.1 protein arginine kinase [Desulforudis sp.]MDZ4043617.1 protein arginine kinase [Eubacteriales bacterium]MBU4532201.1 protein arginine kinase [Bacillota bacterium]MBU4553462.1 protein arginine kinase [Bacillota bacterium]
MTIKQTVDNPYSPWMDDDAPESDIVISSRVRLARDLAGYPFPHLLSGEPAEEILRIVADAVADEDLERRLGKLKVVLLSQLPSLDRQILVDKHLISPDLLKAGNEEAKGVVISEDERLSIMVNEEDHLRIQCILAGLRLQDAYLLADAVDDGLEKTVDYAFSDWLGFLTACLTNIGTGLRASVMMHLPALVATGAIRDVLSAVSKLGLTVRGLYGEGTEASGNLFQLSNQITMGQSEEEIVSNLESITRQVINRERTARRYIFQQKPEALKDKVSRAYGILRHAYLLSAGESMQLLSDVRLGVDTGIIKGVNTRMLSELMVISRPAYLVKTGGRLSAEECDILRARLFREKMTENEGS